MCAFELVSRKVQFPEGPIGNGSALVKVMARRLTGDKPLHDSMLTKVS